jgi:hypothetical protein
MQQPPHPPLPSAAAAAGATSFTPTTTPTTVNKKHPNHNALAVITNPEKSDVLCGRGGQINKHKGNIVYRRVVEFNKAVYKQVPKQQRCLVSQSIVQTVVNHGGRFLQQEQKVWKEIPFRRAVQKTSQALREPSAASGSNSNSSADGEGADADTEHSAADPGITAAAVAAAVDSVDIATTHATVRGEVDNDDNDDNDGDGTSTSTGEASGELKQKQATDASGTATNTSSATLLVAA